MNNFNDTDLIGKITNTEIKLVAGIITGAILIAIFFVYTIPYFYDNKNISQNNNSATVIDSLQKNTTATTTNKIITPPEVNI
jgi:hypothetical protein